MSWCERIARVPAAAGDPDRHSSKAWINCCSSPCAVSRLISTPGRTSAARMAVAWRWRSCLIGARRGCHSCAAAGTANPRSNQRTAIPGDLPGRQPEAGPAARPVGSRMHLQTGALRSAGNPKPASSASGVSMLIQNTGISFRPKSACTMSVLQKPWDSADRPLRRRCSRYVANGRGFGSGTPDRQLGARAVDFCRGGS